MGQFYLRFDTAGHPHHSLYERVNRSTAQNIIIATDMDHTGRKFAKIIETEIKKININKKFKINTPTYKAHDPAELLKILKNKL